MSREGGGLHAELQLDDSVLMIGEEDEARFRRCSMCTSRTRTPPTRALAAGAQTVAEPHDTRFGDHRAAFTDAWGNQWWVATRRQASSAAD
jgi:uncharacterized glyoxalase superfamily protein PhnB